MAKIYVASSWRNKLHDGVIRQLMDAGHEVYDYRNPLRARGFSWSEVDPAWQSWTAEQYRQGLKHPRAQEGFRSDRNAMEWADTGLLLLPSGRSAHLEIGWMARDPDKRTFILTQDGEEPELMALLATHICVSMDEVLWELAA